MADGLGIVAVGVEDEGPVIIGMIFGPETGTDIVLAAGLDRRSIEGIDRGPVGRHEGNRSARS